MSGITIFRDGQLIEHWDDTTRTYTAYDENGEQTESRPYTEAENAEADIRAQGETVAANEQTLRGQTTADIDSLRASIDALNVIIAKTNAEIGPKDTKDLAREMKSIARSTIRIARVVVGAYDSTDVGAS